VQKTEVQWLLQKFKNTHFNSCEGVDGFTLRLQNIVAAPKTMGETILPWRVVEKLMCTIPKSLWRMSVVGCIQHRKQRRGTMHHRHEPTGSCISHENRGRCRQRRRSVTSSTLAASGPCLGISRESRARSS
jgi:hypothetical protein